MKMKNILIKEFFSFMLNNYFYFLLKLAKISKLIVKQRVLKLILIYVVNYHPNYIKFVEKKLQDTWCYLEMQ